MPFTADRAISSGMVARTGEDQRRHRGLGSAASDARADHHQVRRQPVGDDAAEQQEHDVDQRPGADHQAEVAGRAGQVEHGERERDRRDALPSMLTSGRRAGSGTRG